MTGQAVVALLQPGSIDHTRQMGAIVRHCDGDGYVVRAMTPHPHAAVELVRSGDFALIVAAYDVAGRLDEPEVPVEYCRRPRRERRNADPLIERMAAHGLDAETIAVIVAVPIAHVRGVLGTAVPAGPNRRPNRRPRVLTGARR